MTDSLIDLGSKWGQTVLYLRQNPETFFGLWVLLSVDPFSHTPEKNDNTPFKDKARFESFPTLQETKSEEDLENTKQPSRWIQFIQITVSDLFNVTKVMKKDSSQGQPQSSGD